MIARRGAGCSKTNQKSLSAGLASAGIDTRPQPRSRPFSSGMRWSLSSASPGHLERHLGPCPVDLELNRDRLPRRSSLPARVTLQREQKLGAVAGLPAAHVGHAHRQVFGRDLGIGEQMEANALASARGTRRAAPASGRWRRSSRFRAGRSRSRSRCGPPCWP